MLRKDLALGLRSPLFLYAVILPAALTLLVQVVFGSLFAAQPRLGVADLGRSQAAVAAADLEGIEVSFFDDAASLRQAIRENDVDGGFVLTAGFDDAVRAGEKPPVRLLLSGESLVSTRFVLSAAVLDMVREVEAAAPLVRVRFVGPGGAAAQPISARLVPMLVMYALVIAGTFVPASSLVDEKEKGTLTALLVTPLRVSEVVLAKGILGVLLALAMSLVTLAINGVLGTAGLALPLALLVAALFSALLGLVVGTAAGSSVALFTTMKSSGIFLVGPVFFYLFPDWPQWPAMVFPTYWIIDPVWELCILGSGLRAVWVELLVALAIGLALVPIICVLSRRMQSKAAGG